MAAELEPILPDELEDRARSVMEGLSEREWKVATAESCTGGLLAALLTDLPGKSHAFERGFVSYSDSAKCDLLGLEHRMVQNCGAVSRDVALAMAEGALDRSQATVAVSITGFAGPGGEEDEEGLVHFGCACDGKKTAHREEHFGAIGRAGVRLAALDAALEMLEAALEDE